MAVSKKMKLKGTQKSSRVEQAREVYALVYNQISKSSVKAIDEALLEVELEFRLGERTHSDKDEEKRIQDLAEQLRTLAVLTPLIVLKITENKRDRLLVVAGKKRLDAARIARLKKVPCRVLEYPGLFPKSAKSWPEKKKRAILSEVLKSVTYSESAHHERLRDESTYSLLVDSRKNHNLGKNDFDRIRAILGLDRDNPAYQNVLRLWHVACCSFAAELVANKYARLSTLKKHHNIQPLENPKKGNTISARIAHHVQELKSRAKEDEQDKDPIDLTDYLDSDIENIIRDVDIDGISAIGKHANRYRAPKFGYRVDRGLMKIPATTIDFKDRSPNNIRKVVEAFYKLDSAVGQLKSLVEAIKPEEIGGVRRECDMSPLDEGYGAKYYTFIMDRNLQLYSNIAKIEEYLKPIKPLKGPEKLSKKSRSRKAEILIERFKTHAESAKEERESLRNRLRIINDENVLAQSDVKGKSKKAA